MDELLELWAKQPGIRDDGMDVFVGGFPWEKEAAPAPAASKTAGPSGVWIKQLLPGRDIAREKDARTTREALTFGAAKQMRNLIYLVGCLATRECYVVDACWDVEGIVRAAKEHGMKLVGAIASHYHFDHTGGFLMEPYLGMIMGPFAKQVSSKDEWPRLGGIYELCVEHACKLYVHAGDLPALAQQVGLQPERFVPLAHNAALPLGTSGQLTILHTQGHSPGSICVVVTSKEGVVTHAGGESAPKAVISGDTLFPGSCGRLDGDDCSVEAMHDSLERLRALPDDTQVLPGHAYSGMASTIGREKTMGLLRPFSREQWMRMMSHR